MLCCHTDALLHAMLMKEKKSRPAVGPNNSFYMQKQPTVPPWAKLLMLVQY